jgi:PAS domain S-box-containing protein
VTGPDGLIQSARIAAELGVLFQAARVPIIVLHLDGSLEELLSRKIHDLVIDERNVDEDLRLVSTDPLVPLARRRHRRKDGSVLWVVPAASRMTLCGEPYIVSVLQDVTAVALLETRAKKDEQRAEDLWRAASERLTDGIAIMDADCRVLRVNSALLTLLRMSEADVVGKTCRDVFPKCATSERCSHRIALSEQRRHVHEVRSAVTGRPLRIDIIPSPPGSAHFALIVVAHDQTEERAIRSELISADRLATIGRLAAGVAHEVNNPAALVTVNLGVLRDRFAAGGTRPGDVLSMLDESLDGMARIRDIVHDLKGFARERARERVDVGELATSAVRMAAHATRGHARVDKSLGSDVWATVRRARIAQVVLNLLINSAQAIPPGQQSEHRILVSTFRDASLACIEVSDTGRGVPPELAERIFEPFFTTRESSGGTGLGLWLAREIVEEEGGSIVLCRGALSGATFRVSLAGA